MRSAAAISCRVAADLGEQLARGAQLTAIPYYAWANREPGGMRVWIPER